MKKIIGAALLAVILWAAWSLDARNLLQDFMSRVRSLGPAGPAAFIAVYVLACVLMLPGSPLTLGAGAVFGLARGFLWVSLASTLGASAAFLIGRHLARDWVAAKTAVSPRFRALDEAVAAEGWRVVGLARLSPLFPFNLLNYAFGTTRVPFKDYVLASWVGMMPGTFLYVYLGSLAGGLAGLGEPRGRGAAQWGLYIVGLAATVAATVFVTRSARKALDRRLS